LWVFLVFLNQPIQTPFMKKIFLAISILYCFYATAQKTYIHCGKLIDVVNSAVLTQKTIVIEGNKIIEVKDGYAVATAADKIVNLKNATVMPGLMDMHVHVEQQTKRNAQADALTMEPQDVAFKATNYVYTTLMAGFTTVRDLGGSRVNISLRNAINAGTTIGPRIYTAGKSIATTGGHADPTNGIKREFSADPGPLDGVVNGVDECRKAVRQRYKDGSDLIKITATGGVLSQAKDGSSPQFTEEEIKAIVETAKDYGYKVAAHAHGTEGIKRAIRGGVNSIEHGTFLDDECIELFKKYGTYLVPTITAGKATGDSAKIPGYYSAVVTPKALATGPKIQASFAKAYKAGVKFAFGTDAGVYMHGKNYLEFVYMNEAGVPAIETIKSATVYASTLLGVENILGTIEKDKLADIIAVDGDPIKDLNVMNKVVFVMKDGKVYKQ
jgi:imidazolonepropionase-like amidohydrolase